METNILPKINLLSPLPQNMLQRDVPSKVGADKYILSLVRSQLPESDKTQVFDGFKWCFHLNNSGGKKKKKPPQCKRKIFLTKKERKILNLSKLSAKDWKYSTCQNINGLWKQYVGDNFTKIPSWNDSDWNQFSVSLLKMELIGCEMKVIRSAVPSLVGLTGVVMLETKMTFQIVTTGSQLKVIPKESCVFEFNGGQAKFTLFGRNLILKPSEKSSRKVKCQSTFNL